jgi:hypothetical protein
LILLIIIKMVTSPRKNGEGTTKINDRTADTEEEDKRIRRARILRS